MNCLLILVLGIASILAVTVAHGNTIYCYYGAWSKDRSGDGKYTIKDINSKLCTHVVYSFIGLNDKGDIVDNGAKKDLSEFLNLKKENQNVKLIVSMGGWSQGSKQFSHVTNSKSLRSKLIENIYNFIVKYKLDGIDIDWEYPAKRGGKESDKESYVEFLHEIRMKFNKNHLILSAAVEADVEKKSYDVHNMNKYLDYFNVMTYDYVSGTESKTGFNAPLNGQGNLNVVASIEQWIKAGASRDKILLGLAFYGHSYTLKNPSEHGVGAASKGAGKAGPITQQSGELSYIEICKNLKSGEWHTEWDNKNKVPFSYRGDQWVGYDNARSLEMKCNYAKEQNLAGVLIWSIESDDGHNACGDGRNPLLTAVHKALGGGGGNVPDKPKHDKNHNEHDKHDDDDNKKHKKNHGDDDKKHKKHDDDDDKKHKKHHGGDEKKHKKHDDDDDDKKHEKKLDKNHKKDHKDHKKDKEN